MAWCVHAIISHMTTTIIIGSNVLQLTGKGLEYLIDAEGNVLAKFYNGKLIGSPQGNSEATIAA